MNDDRLRSGLNAAAAEIDPGDTDAVHSALTRRVHRRRLLMRGGAFGAVVALIVGVGVIAVSVTGEDEPATLVGIDPTTTAAPPTTAATDDTVAAEVDDTSESDGPGPATTAVPTTTTAAANEPAAAGSSPVEGPDPNALYPEIAVAWRDGFLVAGARVQSQPLPDRLPDEIRELFPQEVLDLFPDGLPDTLAEAQQILTDAGLLEEVTAVLAENQAANDAVYAEPMPPRQYVARFSTDGQTWDDVDLELPAGIEWTQGAQSDGERLVVVGGGSSGSNQPSATMIASTTDLVEWTVHEVPVPPQSADLPEFVNQFAIPESMAFVGDRWVVRHSLNTDINPYLIPGLDIDLDQGYGTSYGPEGITIQFATADGGNDSRTFTWDELGLNPDQSAELAGLNGMGGTHTVTGTFSGGVDDSSADPNPGFGPSMQIVATSEGFIDFAAPVRFSADGITWADRPVELGEYVNATMSAGDGVVVFYSDADGETVARRLDAQGNDLGAVELPELPNQWSPMHSGFAWNASGQEALVIDVFAGIASDPEPIVLTHDGYVLTLPGEQFVPWTLVDEATGEVLAQGVFDEESPAYTLDFGFNGSQTVVDTTSGDTIVEIPSEVFEEALPAPQEYSPDLWLVGSRDGEQFFVEDLADPQSGDFYGAWAISNDGRVLVYSSNDWVLVTLP